MRDTLNFYRTIVNTGFVFTWLSYLCDLPLKRVAIYRKLKVTVLVRFPGASKEGRVNISARKFLKHY